MIEYQFREAVDTTSAFHNLYEIISLLRSENGCPYDKAQTEKSSLGNLIDEAYEYLEALNKEDTDLCKEELGDVLLNVFSILQIHEDKNDFTSIEVLNDVCRKLIRRHPHVFSTDKANTAEEGLDLWNKAKEKEGRDNSIKAVLEHIPSAMPPLEKSYEIQKKLGKIGFEWTNVDDVIDKVYEELDEVKEAIHEENSDHIEDELGDLFLTIVNLARYVKVRPDQALERANYKITSRFVKLYDLASERNIPVDKEHLDELDKLWDEVKKTEN